MLIPVYHAQECNVIDTVSYVDIPNSHMPCGALLCCGLSSCKFHVASSYRELPCSTRGRGLPARLSLAQLLLHFSLSHSIFPLIETELHLLTSNQPISTASTN